MYFITVIEDFDKDYGVKGCSRCVGYYNTFEKANKAVRENKCDLWETCYNYAVIEKIEEGLYQTSYEKRWFYKFDCDKGIYEPIEEPEEVKHWCNFAIG
ncbi:hypothetical protein [Thermoanaerobacterium sp. RBIITD]|uniref:hypothetical protein n=1 Tax=Thermoanaerobacterium sp. RBIITD TaxID=1550240 RepID=UPI000BB99C41|nr:hypothetical protein [Thermoanaerobacterium sp. RBIITD]SNX54151.1 hypothetical protein SAMN05660242_1784 [Thermoanaerobacterium sp. RBIITD]